MTPNQLSEQLLLLVKKGEPTIEAVEQLANLSLEELKDSLISEDHKKAFWINLYNAFFLILRKEKGVQKPAIFRGKLIRVAGHDFSLDDIEHGILRKYRWKWSLGYLPNIWASDLIKKLAVHKIDYRIHFALNCGAKSCPPIAFYTPDDIEQQLEMATISFLEQETEVKAAKKEVHVTRLFQWYKGDFGGTSGIKRILHKKLGVDTRGKRLIYRSYDWTEALDQFK